MRVAYKNTHRLVMLSSLYFQTACLMFSVKTENYYCLANITPLGVRSLEEVTGIQTSLNQISQNIGLKHLGTAPHTGKKVHTRYRQS